MVDVANFAARNFGGGPDLANIDLQRTRNALGQLQLNQETAMGPLRQQALQQGIETGQANENRINQQDAAAAEAQKHQFFYSASKHLQQHPESWPAVVQEAKNRQYLPQDFNQPYDPQKIQQYIDQFEISGLGAPPDRQILHEGDTLRENGVTVATGQPKDEPLQAIIGQDGKPTLVPRSQAVNKTPYNPSVLASGGPVTPDVVDSYRQQILAGNATLANVPMNYRGDVANALTGTSKDQFSPTASSRMTLAASRITQPFTNMSAYKLTADGKPYLERIDAAMKTPGSVSDQDLLDSLTKLNTGGNAVTDAQVSLITHGKSFADTAATFANKFKNGGVLSPDQRQQIHDIAYQIYDNYKKGYQPIYDQAAKQLTQAGIPKQFWTIPDLNSLNSGQPASGGAGGGGAAPEGTVISNGKQTLKKVGGQWVPQ